MLEFIPTEHRWHMLDWTSSRFYHVCMAKRPVKKKKPAKDTQQLARSVLDAIAPDAEPKADKPEKNAAAVALGRLGGLKGGKARAAKLTAAKRKAIAKKAAQTRWEGKT
jgi:hypothetical protein